MSTHASYPSHRDRTATTSNIELYVAKLTENRRQCLLAGVCGVQDEHILARKYADRWMGRALGVGLFRRRLYRKEVEDTRQLLFSTLNPTAKVRPCPCSDNVQKSC